MLLREDNLGLGAKVGGNKAETFGLSLFSGVLGRLNGKSDEQVQKQQDALGDAELRQYQVGKYGLMNFVSGGLLVGDKIQKPGEEDAGRLASVKSTDNVTEGNGKKRKATDEDGSGETKAKKKKQKSRNESEPGSPATQQPLEHEEDAERVCRREKKKAKRVGDQPEIIEASEMKPAEKTSKKRRKDEHAADVSTTIKASKEEKARLKQEKRARKEDRRKRKEAKRLKRAKTQESEVVEEEEPETKKPAAAAAQFSGGRHSVRHRYIQQKRMAGRDAQAMKEIFMIKAAA